MAQIPENFREVFQKRTFAHLSTLMPDGSPQSSVVWIDLDGEHIIVNSAEGRLKDRNMRRDPRVAISMADPDNPYRSLMIRGRVVSVTSEGADEHIDRMAKKYLDKDKYPFRAPGEVRVLYRISPERVSSMG